MSEAKALRLLETVQHNVEWDNVAYPQFVTRGPFRQTSCCFCPQKHENCCSETFLSGTRSLQGTFTKWGVSESTKPHPEAKLCFYWVDRSKHVHPPCQHPTLATLFTPGLWISVIDCTVPNISMKPKDNAARNKPFKAAHGSSPLIKWKCYFQPSVLCLLPLKLKLQVVISATAL